MIGNNQSRLGNIVSDFNVAAALIDAVIADTFKHSNNFLAGKQRTYNQFFYFAGIAGTRSTTGKILRIGFQI